MNIETGIVGGLVRIWAQREKCHEGCKSSAYGRSAFFVDFVCLCAAHGYMPPSLVFPPSGSCTILYATQWLAVTYMSLTAKGSTQSAARDMTGLYSVTQWHRMAGLCFVAISNANQWRISIFRHGAERESMTPGLYMYFYVPFCLIIS